MARWILILMVLAMAGCAGRNKREEPSPVACQMVALGEGRVKFVLRNTTDGYVAICVPNNPIWEPDSHLLKGKDRKGKEVNRVCIVACYFDNDPGLYEILKPREERAVALDVRKLFAKRWNEELVSEAGHPREVCSLSFYQWADCAAFPTRAAAERAISRMRGERSMRGVARLECEAAVKW